MVMSVILMTTSAATSDLLHYRRVLHLQQLSIPLLLLLLLLLLAALLSLYIAAAHRGNAQAGTTNWPG
jgi:hypothetical protein